MKTLHDAVNAMINGKEQEFVDFVREFVSHFCDGTEPAGVVATYQEAAVWSWNEGRTKWNPQTKGYVKPSN